MQIHLEKKFSCYVFLHITEATEVTQEINSTGIIPLEALRAHLPKRPHNATVESLLCVCIKIYLNLVSTSEVHISKYFG